MLKFNEYLLTLNGINCILWISELAQISTEEGGRFALIGVLEVHEDFLIIHGENGIPTACRFDQIICIEVNEFEEEEEEEPEIIDVHHEFEQMYRKNKGLN